MFTKIMVERLNQNSLMEILNAWLGDVKRAHSSKAVDFSPLSPIRFEELGFTGIYEKLGIKPVYATPYNARAKVIERFFLDFQESFLRV